MTANITHDLAMLYLQQHEYLSLNPQELTKKYLEIKQAIIEQLDPAGLKNSKEL